ncbi:MAG: hypothetical protein LLF89_02385, partial [Spirochaetaceae bacterium]|nr:hypothetical protein [Spirochaetaceae bacterium]
MQFSKASENNQGQVAIFIRSSYKDFMMQSGALVLYKTHIGLITAFSEGKYAVAFSDASALRLREKDFSLLHPGPLSRFPEPRQDGDFETAYAMLVPDGADSAALPLTWKDFSELVFGIYTAESAMACAACALKGQLFAVSEGQPYALGSMERARLLEKEQKRKEESAARQAFIEWFRAARKLGHADSQAGSRGTDDDKESLDAKRNYGAYAPYVQELESFCLGRSAHCPIALDSGLSETTEAVHQALLESGIWTDSIDPWPSRAGCSLNAPKPGFPLEELASAILPRLDLRA